MDILRLGCIGLGFVLARGPLVRHRIRKLNRMLIVSSRPLAGCLSLWSSSRRVMIDPSQRVVRILDRRVWFWKRYRRIAFEQVAGVLYEYHDISPFPSLSHAYQEIDLYSLALLLHSGRTIDLFRFAGQGDFVNDTYLPDWMFWDSELDAAITRGTQDDESRMLAETISRLIGVPITNSERLL